MTAPSAIQVYQRTKELLRSEEVQARFREILDKNTPAFVASILNTVYLSEYLRDAEPNSVIVSALTAAALGLPVDPNLGFAYLVPYREKGTKIARFQIGWKGLVQLAQRSGQYRLLNASEIYEGQEIHQNQLTGQIVLNGKRTSDKVIGYVAYFQLVNGFEKFVYMTADEVIGHARRYSKSYGDEKSPWAKNFNEMAKKTVIKRLLSGYGPLSIQMQQAIGEEHESESDSRPLSNLPVVEAQFTEPPVETGVQLESEPEQPETPPAESPTRMDWPRFLVANQAAPTEADAEKMVRLLKLVDDTPSGNALEIARLYNGWISSTGCKPEQAAKMALEGKQPA